MIKGPDTIADLLMEASVLINTWVKASFPLADPLLTESEKQYVNHIDRLRNAQANDTGCLIKTLDTMYNDAYYVVHAYMHVDKKPSSPFGQFADYNADAKQLIIRIKEALKTQRIDVVESMEIRFPL